MYLNDRKKLKQVIYSLRLTEFHCLYSGNQFCAYRPKYFGNMYVR